jgi:branched-chain amino acid transport system permease protein
MKITKGHLLLWLLLLAALAVYPSVFGIVYTNLFIRFLIFALFAASLNLLLSFTGLLSFGHAMFFGVGGYAAALTLEHIPNVGLFTAIFVGASAGSLLALIVSPMLVRVKDTAFALLTLALNQLLFIACLKLRGLTYGEDGVGGFPTPPLDLFGLFSVDISYPPNFFYFTLCIVGLSLFLMWYATRTPFGSIMIGIRDNPNRVGYLGFNIPFSKTVIFLISGFFAGLAGALFALFQNLVSPDAVMHILNSFTAIMMTFVGGIGTFLGPIAGAAIMIGLENLAVRHTEKIFLINGLLLIVVVLFFRSGFVGLYNLAKARWYSK